MKVRLKRVFSFELALVWVCCSLSPDITNIDDLADNRFDCGLGLHKDNNDTCWQTLHGGCLFLDANDGSCFSECSDGEYYFKGSVLKDDGSFESLEMLLKKEIIDNTIKRASQESHIEFQNYCEAYIYENPNAECFLETSPTLIKIQTEDKDGNDPDSNPAYLPQSIHGFFSCDDAIKNWQPIDNYQGCLISEGVDCQLLSCKARRVQDGVDFAIPAPSKKESSHLLSIKKFKERFGADCKTLLDQRSKRGVQFW